MNSGTKKSLTTVIAPIISALIKTENLLGPERNWRAINLVQESFLEKHFSKRGELRHFTEEELRNWISDDAEELNKILKKEGFEIRLDEFDKSRNEFGVVSILDVLVEWVKKADKTQLLVGNTRYPAVSMKPEERVEKEILRIFEGYDVAGHKYPLARVHTKSGDVVCMTIAPEHISADNLIVEIDMLRQRKASLRYYDFLEFPMIDYDEKVDISWLTGLWTLDEQAKKWKISQALQQTKFKMNQEGAHVKSAVALAVMRGISLNAEPKKILKINKPFFLWIEREGLSLPIIYAYFDSNHWKDPKSLDM